MFLTRLYGVLRRHPAETRDVFSISNSYAKRSLHGKLCRVRGLHRANHIRVPVLTYRLRIAVNTAVRILF